jgi:hypothetical protein
MRLSPTPKAGEGPEHKKAAGLKQELISDVY